jgi:hypothetical protein
MIFDTYPVALPVVSLNLVRPRRSGALPLFTCAGTDAPQTGRTAGRRRCRLCARTDRSMGRSL